MAKKVNILGSDYYIIKRDYCEDDTFLNKGAGGYCSMMTHEIVVCNMETFPGYESESKEFTSNLQKEILRHEVVHAFLYESGLNYSSHTISDCGWACDEEIVDWIAIQLPKLAAILEKLNALY